MDAPSHRRISEASTERAFEPPLEPQLLRSLQEYRWWVVASVAVCLAAASAHVQLAQPIYRADALLHVDYGGSGMDPLQESEAAFNPESPAEGEIDIIRSRSIVGQVLDPSAKEGSELRVDEVNAFLSNLSVTERGRNTGVLHLQLEGPDPRLIAGQLDALMAAYVKQDSKRRALEAERRLQFVEGQLPLLKVSLDEAEQRVQRFRAQRGKLSIDLEAQALLERAARIESEGRALDLSMEDLRQRFSRTHPSVVTLNRKRAQLASERKKLQAESEALPETELEWLRLNRDVKVASQLYDQLLTKAQELSIWKSGTIGRVRIIDRAAVSRTPTSPRKAVELSLGLLAGLSLGLIVALVRTRAKGGLWSVEGLEQTLKLPVFAQVAHSTAQARLERKARRGAASAPLAQAAGGDGAVESLRALRESLLFQISRSNGKVLMLAASEAGAGRTFIAVNLAHLLAAAGKRVLLVDGDLREGPLRRWFPQGSTGGLSAFLAGDAWSQCIFQTDVPLLHVLPAGKLLPMPAERIRTARFVSAMRAATSSYDVVLIVAPPVLPFADAAVLGKAADLTLLVARVGDHSLGELASALSRLRQAGISPSGFVVNGVR